MLFKLEAYMTNLKCRQVMICDETWSRFNQKTAEEGTSKSAKIRELIEEYLGMNNEEDEHKDYQELIEGRVYENIIRYSAIEYISMKTGTDIDEIIRYIKHETNYLINYERN